MNSKLNFEEINLNEYDKDLKALQYAGFDPGFMRQICINRMGIRDTIQAVCAYTMVGNNISRMSHQRNDEERSRNLMVKFQDLGVKGTGVKSRGRDTVTFPRIAMAFAPFLYLVRAKYKNLMQSRGFNGLDIVEQDIALSPLMKYQLLDRRFNSFLSFFSEIIGGDERTVGFYSNLAADQGLEDEFFKLAVPILIENRSEILDGNNFIIDDCFNRVMDALRDSIDTKVVEKSSNNAVVNKSSNNKIA